MNTYRNTNSCFGYAKERNPVLTPALQSSSGGSWYVGSPAKAIADFETQQPALYAQLSALERFNGQPVIERYTRATNSSYYDAATGSYKGYTYYSVSIEPQRLPFFQTAYDSLKASTYQSLYLQTEGNELLDSQRKLSNQHKNAIAVGAARAEIYWAVALLDTLKPLVICVLRDAVRDRLL